MFRFKRFARSFLVSRERERTYYVRVEPSVIFGKTEKSQRLRDDYHVIVRITNI